MRTVPQRTIREVLKIKKRSKSLKPFPQVRLANGLEISRIPESEAVKMTIVLDRNSFQILAFNSSKEQLAPEELTRRLIWSYVVL